MELDRRGQASFPALTVSMNSTTDILNIYATHATMGSNPPALTFEYMAVVASNMAPSEHLIVAFRVRVLKNASLLKGEECNALLYNESSFWKKARQEFSTFLQRMVGAMGQVVPSFENPSCFHKYNQSGSINTSMEIFKFNGAPNFLVFHHPQYFELVVSSEVETFLENTPWRSPKFERAAREFGHLLQHVSFPCLRDSGEIKGSLTLIVSPHERCIRMNKRRKTSAGGSTCLSITFNKEITENNTILFSANWNDNLRNPVTIEEWATVMVEESQRGELSRLEMSEAIRTIPFEAAFFEVKGATAETVKTEAFEFVTINGPSLANRWNRGGDPTEFAAYFKGNDQDATWFSNIGGDARLVCPQPPTSLKMAKAYAHLLPFLRSAPKAQISGLWRLVASQYMTVLEAKFPEPVWLSTSGEGVAWLHFRLDDRPKYYQYAPFALQEGAADDDDSDTPEDESSSSSNCSAGDSDESSWHHDSEDEGTLEK